MVRRIASCAALVALVVCLSACQCGKVAAGPAKAKSGGSTEAMAPASGSGSGHSSDMYPSEQDRDMGRVPDHK